MKKDPRLRTTNKVTHTLLSQEDASALEVLETAALEELTSDGIVRQAMLVQVVGSDGAPIGNTGPAAIVQLDASELSIGAVELKGSGGAMAPRADVVELAGDNGLGVVLLDDTGVPINILPVAVDALPGVDVLTLPELDVSTLPVLNINSLPDVTIVNMPDVTLAGISNMAITNQPTVDVATMPDISLAGTSDVNIVNANVNTNITNQPTVNVATIPDVTVTTLPAVTLAGTPDVNITNANVNTTITNKPLVDVATLPAVTLAGTPDINIANIPHVIVDSMDSVEVTTMPEVTLAGTSAVSVTNVPHVIVDAMDSVAVTTMPDVTLAGTPDVNIANTNVNTAITNQPTVDVATMPAVTLAGTPDVNVATLPDVTLAGTPDVNVTNIPHVVVDTLPGVDLVGAPDVTIANVPHTVVDSIPDVTLAGTSDVNITNVSMATSVTNQPTVDVATMPAVTLAGAPDVNVATIPDVTLAGTSDVNVTNIPHVIVDSMDSVEVTAMPAVTLAGTPDVNIANTSMATTITNQPTVDVATMPAVTLAGTPVVNISNQPTVDVATLPAVTLAGTPDVNIANTSMATTITNKPTVDVATLPDVTLAGTSDVNIANANVNTTITNQPTVDVATMPDVTLAGTPDINITNANVNTSVTNQPTVDVATLPDVTLAGTPVVNVGTMPSVVISSMPDISVGGSSIVHKELGEGTAEAPSIPYNINGGNELCIDAWGRQKAVTDYSMFSGLWTFAIPNRMWLGNLRDATNSTAPFIEQVFIPKDNSNPYARSENGMMVLASDSTYDVKISSKRHLRYQPNRGYLYSTAVIMPNPTNVGVRQVGMICEGSGMYYELVGNGSSWAMFMCRRTTVSGVITDHRVDITAKLPTGFDPAKGHVYDIQAQWRGVGNIKFFIDLALIDTFNLLGTLTATNISNPAMTVAFVCIGNGIELKVGCVDVTSEGGSRSHKIFTSTTTGGLVAFNNSSGPQALIAVRVPKTIMYHGVSIEYTRDMVLTRMTAFSDDEYVAEIWTGRSQNLAHMNALPWVDNSDSFWQHVVALPDDDLLNDAFNSDKPYMIDAYGVHQQLNSPVLIDNASPDDTDIYITCGETYVFSINPRVTNGKSGGVTVEFAEEV